MNHQCRRLVPRAIALALTGGILWGLATPTSATAGFDPEKLFVSHKATYAMKMVAARDTRNISSVDGTITYEWADSCDAWTTNQKFELGYQYTEASPEKFISDYSSWEAKDAQSFSFTSHQATDQQAVDMVRGSVERTPNGGIAEFVRPESRMVKLEKGFAFPSQHTFDVLRHAAAGEKFFSAQMYDGSDDKGPVLISTIVLDHIPPATAQEQPEPFLRAPGYRVRMAYFDNTGKGDPVEDASPAYEMTLDLLENGIVRKLRIDYREFSIEGNVSTFTLIPKAHC